MLPSVDEIAVENDIWRRRRRIWSLLLDWQLNNVIALQIEHRLNEASGQNVVLVSHLRLRVQQGHIVHFQRQQLRVASVDSHHVHGQVVETVLSDAQLSQIRHAVEQTACVDKSQSIKKVIPQLNE